MRVIIIYDTGYIFLNALAMLLPDNGQAVQSRKYKMGV
jgi:hypothetical protein